MMCMGGMGHAFSICSHSCGEVSLGTFGVAAPMTRMSCNSLCLLCCISRHSAFRGKSVTLFVDHGPCPASCLH